MELSESTVMQLLSCVGRTRTTTLKFRPLG